MLTDRQKEAINLIRELRGPMDVLKDEEFYLLLEFIMGNQQSTQYIPWPVETPYPIYPSTVFPIVTYQTTCKQEIK